MKVQFCEAPLILIDCLPVMVKMVWALALREELSADCGSKCESKNQIVNR